MVAASANKGAVLQRESNGNYVHATLVGNRRIKGQVRQLHKARSPHRHHGRHGRGVSKPMLAKQIERIRGVGQA